MIKKITSYRLNLVSGTAEKENVEVKVRSFSEGEMTSFLRRFLVDRGYSEHIGSKIVTHKRYGNLQYLTLFGKPIKTKYVGWQSDKDSDGGKAVFFIGERNTVGYEKVEGGVIVKGRIIPTDIYWYCLIVAPRKTFKSGMSIKEQEFIDFLLMPLDEIVEEFKKGNGIAIDLRKSHREKYAFDKMVEILRTKEETL
jgi:hypothetical protein